MSELNSDPVEFVTLGELTDKPVDQTGPLSDFIYIDISCIDRESKKIIDPKNVLLSEAPSRAKQVLKDGDILVSMTRPNLNAVAFVPSHLDGAIGSTGFHVLRSSWLHPKYLLALVQTNDFVDAMSAVVQGALYPAVRPRDIAAYSLRFETTKHQTRIVEKLEELLTGLDAGVAELKSAQKKLAQYRQSLLKAAVEGALSAEWRANNPPTETGAQLLERILQERRARWEAKQLAKFKEQGKAPPKDWQKKYPEPVQPDATDVPELPQGWVWASVDQLAAIGTGVTPLKSKSQYYLDGDIPWITSGALNNEIVKEAFEHVTPLALKECRLEIYPVGSLLVAMYGEGKTRGKCSELAIPATINQAIAALVLEDAAIFCKPYIKSFLLKSYDDMRNQASGGVQPNLNLQIIRSIAIPMPPLDEQHAITDTLSAQLGTTKDQGTAIELSLKQSTAQRQNILKAAFSGQLVAQDPSDEPASELLERIRAERAAQQTVKKPRGRKAKEAA